ncbi:hypothetical protein PG993_006422 [Apiospora rasikravindrae]|uniref:Uncharacterized protein n=1 Tax=Apiospora rasikravindrae TaxID=990691 RepID=A0ABR1T7S5_9PEZI
MQDFTSPNLPAITVRPPSNLPNRHHEAIVSASGNPSVPPRAFSSFSPDRPPAIPPRGSSLNRGDKMRRLLEQAAQVRERLASMGSIPPSSSRSDSQGNRVRFQGIVADEGGSSSSDRRSFSGASSFSPRRNDGACLVRSSSLRPPPFNLTIANSNNTSNTNKDNKSNDNDTNTSSDIRSTSRVSTERSMSRASSSGVSKGKGKARAETRNAFFNDDNDEDDDGFGIMTPMLPIHHIASADDDNAPRTPIAAMPLSGLPVPRSEPKSENGLPVTPRYVG